eukprot:scaffold12817_cov75-Phaeocystis_antarctica.AAC.3
MACGNRAGQAEVSEPASQVSQVHTQHTQAHGGAKEARTVQAPRGAGSLPTVATVLGAHARASARGSGRGATLGGSSCSAQVDALGAETANNAPARRGCGSTSNALSWRTLPPQSCGGALGLPKAADSNAVGHPPRGGTAAPSARPAATPPPTPASRRTPHRPCRAQAHQVGSSRSAHRRRRRQRRRRRARWARTSRHRRSERRSARAGAAAASRWQQRREREAVGWSQPPGAWLTSRHRPRPRPQARAAAWARAGASRGRAPHAAAPAAKAAQRRAARRAAKAQPRAAARRKPRRRRSGATRPGPAARRWRPARRLAAARRTAPPVRACTAAGCARAETALPRAVAGSCTAQARGRARHACRAAIASDPRCRGRRARPSCAGRSGTSHRAPEKPTGQSHVPAHSSQTPRVKQAGSPQRLDAAEERMRSVACERRELCTAPSRSQELPATRVPTAITLLRVGTRGRQRSRAHQRSWHHRGSLGAAARDGCARSRVRGSRAAKLRVARAPAGRR